MQNQASYQPGLSIIAGYLDHIDQDCTEARKSGLDQRLAIVLDTFNPESGELYLDMEMLTSILGEVVLTFHFDEIVMFIESRKHTFYTFEDCLLQLRKNHANGELPFECLHLLSGQDMNCYAELVDYAAVGGPPPYHDSYTLVFYYKTPPAAFLQASVETLCRKNGYRIRNRFEGSTKPNISLLDKIRKLF